MLASSLRASSQVRAFGRRTTTARKLVVPRGFKVEVTHNGQTKTLDVPEDENILTVALDNGMDLPHDCRLGVCMTCPAKLTKGQVDQSGCMLSDDVVELGYTLLCMAQPRSDCSVTIISEDELLDLQLQAGKVNA